MKNAAKLVLILVFVLGAFFVFLNGVSIFTTDAAGVSQLTAQASPTPNKNANVSAANTDVKPAAANTNTVPANVPPLAGGKSIPKTFTLGTDSQSEYGEAVFDHDSHAFKNYSPDGKSVMGCVECHHTDAPKSALKSPYTTSERSETLTFETWQRSSQPVTKCRDCHFQDGNVPDGKTMPRANNKDLNNQLAYHINCNTCHDAAFKARPEIKSHKGFATSKDCAVCHKVS